MRFLVIGFVYLVLYAAGAWSLRDQPPARTVFGTLGIVLPAVAMCAVVVYRRRDFQGCQKLFWGAAALGVGLWVIGYLGWAFEAASFGSSGWLRWHTLVSLCGGIIPLIALLARPHQGIRHGAVTGVALLMASYGLLAVFIYTDFLLVPSLVLPQEEARRALLLLVQGNRAALAIGFLLAAWIGWSTPWRQTYLLLAAGVTVGFLLRFVTVRGIFDPAYQAGTVFDLAFVAPFMFYAWAAWIAPASSPDGERAQPAVPMLPAFWTAVPVLLIPLIGYLALWFQPLGGNGDAFRALLTALMTAAGLGFLTLRLSIQGGELQRTDARLRLLAAATEQTQELILITREDGRVEHANDAFVRAIGYSRHELSRLAFSELLDKDFGQTGRKIRGELNAAGVWRGTLLRRRRDGSTFPAACTVTALRENGGIAHLVGVERDITEELRLQDQLVHTERLSAIGELVAGVAHEINNPLQTIVGSVELLLEDEPTPAAKRDLETVRREAARAAQIVRSLLAFVRRGNSERSPVDLNAVAREAIGLRDFQMQQKAISLTVELSPAPVMALGSREELLQVVMNLLLNAEQAVGASGDGAITVRTFTTGARQCLEIVDNGPGVGEELRGRIFEPFFTTKPVGEGTGLGLSISHGIASAHGGTLELGAEGGGAAFRLLLPAHEPMPVALPDAEEPVEPSGTARPWALVVDDELPIRRLVARLLRKRNYEVIEAGSGDEALAAFSERTISVVLCDVRMPGMTGPELFARVDASGDASAPAFIFMTGDRGGVHEQVPGVPMLDKPFTGAELDQALAALHV